MAVATPEAVLIEPIARSPSYWRTVAMRFRRDPVAMVAAAVVLGLILMAIFAPWLVPDDPNKGMTLRRLKPVGTPGFILGTDELGRDMLSRLIMGARLSLFMGVTPVFIALLIGGAIGVIAGYAGGWLNTILMRTIDVFFAFPSVLLAIALSGALGAGITNGLLSLTIVFIPPIARLHRGGAGERRQCADHHPSPCARQRAGADPGLRHEPDRGFDDPGFRLVVPGARREAARARVGLDAEHPAHRDLHPAAAMRLARRDDLHHFDRLQHADRRPALVDGFEGLSSSGRLPLPACRPTL